MPIGSANQWLVLTERWSWSRSWTGSAAALLADPNSGDQYWAPRWFPHRTHPAHPEIPSVRLVVAAVAGAAAVAAAAAAVVVVAVVVAAAAAASDAAVVVVVAAAVAVVSPTLRRTSRIFG